jgi:PTH2 family peptidyl-tRNA hydrolase
MVVVKQVICVRTDLGMSAGKIAAQACHASLGSFQSVAISKEINRLWKKNGAAKIVLKVTSMRSLAALQQKAEAMGLAYYAVADAGLTEVDGGTVTCLAIGPGDEDAIDQITGKLNLL